MAICVSLAYSSIYVEHVWGRFSLGNTSQFATSETPQRLEATREEVQRFD